MIYDINCKYFNTLIIGSGGAGLMSAISASDNNLKNIAIISKTLFEKNEAFQKIASKLHPNYQKYQKSKYNFS